MTLVVDFLKHMQDKCSAAQPKLQRDAAIQGVMELGLHLNASRRNDSMEWHSQAGQILARSGLDTAHIYMPALKNLTANAATDRIGTVTTVTFNALSLVKPVDGMPHTFMFEATYMSALPSGNCTINVTTKQMNDREMEQQVRDAHGGNKAVLARIFLPTMKGSSWSNRLKSVAGVARL